MPSRLLRIIVACAVLWLPMQAARAQDVAFPDPESVVPGQKSTTYLDLARLIVPDLAPRDGGYGGTKVVGVRPLEEGGEPAEPPARVAFLDLSVLTVTSSGRPRLAMLLDLGQAAGNAEGYAVLALFDPDGEKKLLDAVGIAFDQQTYFRDPARLGVAEDTDLVLTMSTHFNSSQAYVTTALVLARNDRFALVDTVFTFDDAGCSYRRAQLPRFETRPSTTGGLADIVATIEETTSPTVEECDDPVPEPPTRSISVTYRWDEKTQRYYADTDAFERLAEENAQRF